MINNYTVPLLSDSIAVSLQNDLLDFYNETKFLLLFFDNPLAVLSTHRFEVLNAEAIFEIKNNRLPKTVLGSDYQLQNTALLKTDEWDELMSHCQVYTAGYEMKKFNDPKGLLSTDLQSYIAAIQDNPYDIEAENREDFSIEDMFKNISNSLAKIKSTTFEMQLWRLEFLLSECYKKKIPMVWSNGIDVHVCKFYLEYLMSQAKDGFFISKSDADIRHLLGQSLLKEVLEFDIVDLTTVPIDKIIDFKKNNRDLLDNFSMFYSSFLVDLQAEPKDYQGIVKNYSGKLRTNLNEIQQELGILRNKRKYSWLKLMSNELFDNVQGNLATSTWTLLTSPIEAAGKILNVGKGVVGAQMEKSESLKSLIINSSAGYLWKAKQEFKSK